MGAAVRLRNCACCPVRLTAPRIDAPGVEASRRLDALETLIFKRTESPHLQSVCAPFQ